MFVHDSEHTHQAMTFEFNTVWPFLRNGLLVSDDVNQNDAFLEFGDRVQRFPLLVKSKNNIHGIMIN